MASSSPSGSTFAYKLTTDDKGTYIQMFAPGKKQMLKSLLFSLERFPGVENEGEAWIETNGSNVVTCIPLKGEFVEGWVVGVALSGISVETSTGAKGCFPAAWGPTISQIRVFDEAKVAVKKQAIYVLPGSGQRPLPPMKPWEQPHVHPHTLIQQATAPAYPVNASLPAVIQSATMYQPPAYNSVVPNYASPNQDWAGTGEKQQSGTLVISAEEIAAFHRPSEENFKSREPEIGVAIGRHRLPIEVLQQEYRWNPMMVQKFQELQARYPMWRRSRGDGNCFYRCLGVLLLEHLCRPDTPAHDVFTMARDMINQNGNFTLQNTQEHDFQYVKLFLRLLKELNQYRNTGQNALQQVQYLLQREKTDKAVIVSMRNYTANYVIQHRFDPALGPFILDFEELLREISEYGKEAEGVALIAAAQCFSVGLRIITVDNKSQDVTETVYGPVVPGHYPTFSLLHIPGHYNYLIRREVVTADGYDFNTNTYKPVMTRSVLGYEQFPQ